MSLDSVLLLNTQNTTNAGTISGRLFPALNFAGVSDSQTLTNKTNMRDLVRRRQREARDSVLDDGEDGGNTNAVIHGKQHQPDVAVSQSRVDEYCQDC